MPYAPPLDTNSDRGYGRTTSKFHDPRSSGKSYPYLEKDNWEEYEDEETSDAIASKLDFPIKTDTYSAAGKDSFYFVAGNIKLSDCFERPDDVLKEIHSLGDSMSPIKSNHRSTGQGRSGGSSFPSGVGSYLRTETKRGYFSAPPKFKVDQEEKEFWDEEDIPIMNLKDLARKQDK